MRAPRERERAARRGRRGGRAHAGAPRGRAPRARRALPLVAGARAAPDAQQVLFSYKVLSHSLVTINLYNISFTLYPAHSRVGRENLVLRTFPPNSGGIAC